MVSDLKRSEKLMSYAKERARETGEDVLVSTTKSILITLIENGKVIVADSVTEGLAEAVANVVVKVGFDAGKFIIKEILETDALDKLGAGVFVISMIGGFIISLPAIVLGVLVSEVAKNTGYTSDEKERVEWYDQPPGEGPFDNLF